jgi:hypothetical protein
MPRIPSAAKLEKWLMVLDEQPSAAFKEAMAAMLDRLWELACSKQLDTPFRCFKAKVMPIEFVYIGVPHPLAPHPRYLPSHPPSLHLHLHLHLHRHIALHNVSRLHARGAVACCVHPLTRHPQCRQWLDGVMSSDTLSILSCVPSKSHTAFFSAPMAPNHTS